MKIYVRAATEDDIEAIFEIRTNVNENHLSLGQLADMGITPATVKAKMLSTTHSQTWIAEVNTVPVGFAIAHANDGSVFALFIKAEFEGHGIGTRLMSQVEAFLFEHHNTIWPETDGSSQASGFYRHVGWTPAEHFENADIRLTKSFSTVTC